MRRRDQASPAGRGKTVWRRTSFQALLVTLGLALWMLPARADPNEWIVAAGAAGQGTPDSPFGRIQDALDAARPGDTITIRPGTYAEALRTVRSGLPEARIRLRAAGPRGSVLVSVPGKVLTVDHAHVTLEGLVIDAQYAHADAVDVNRGADHLVLRDLEVRRSSRDLIDISNPRGVLIENSLLHRALNATGGRKDAHGIVAGAVQGLTIRNTEIHTFSGDGFQADPGRAVPGWTDVVLEDLRIWLAPLGEAENGFRAGTVPGENAVDTKANARAQRAKLTIRNVEARGFGGGLITNMAAFNLKENIDATIDGVTVLDSEIAFRLRGPTNAAGAWVSIRNAVVHDTAVAFRYEDDIERVAVWNSTLGTRVTRAFHAASSSDRGLDVRNLLVLGPLPPEARGATNLSVGPNAFVDARASDYRLAPGSMAIDAGATLIDVATDRDGTPRPHGRAYDVGAYERVP